jgi:hypothetical protein
MFPELWLVTRSRLPAGDPNGITKLLSIHHRAEDRPDPARNPMNSIISSPENSLPGFADEFASNAHNELMTRMPSQKTADSCTSGMSLAALRSFALLKEQASCFVLDTEV